jgi:hypothetical protein
VYVTYYLKPNISIVKTRLYSQGDVLSCITLLELRTIACLNLCGSKTYVYPICDMHRKTFFKNRHRRHYFCADLKQPTLLRVGWFKNIPYFRLESFVWKDFKIL